MESCHKPKERLSKTRAPKEPALLKLLPKNTEIDRWIILGLDPSLSRTGFAVMLVDRDGAHWIEVGSVKPENASDPVWVRSKAVALSLRLLLKKVADFQPSLERTGLILSLEAPTPQNDFLTSINRILHLVLLEGSVSERFAATHIQMTNASTLRSLMGLTQRGASNKTENVRKAYTFLDEGSYPNLDTDACDAVLMGMMGRYTAALLLGTPEPVPERFLIALCNATEEVVGKGRNARTRIKGILHRREYFTTYARQNYSVLLRDARAKKAKLDRLTFSI